MPYQFDANAGFLGSAWARGDHNAIGMHRLDFSDGYLVVAANLNLAAQFADVLDQVVSERIVVIEDEYHESIVAANGARLQSFKASRKRTHRCNFDPTDRPLRLSLKL